MLQFFSLLFVIPLILSATIPTHVFKETANLQLHRHIQLVQPASPHTLHTVIFSIHQKNIPELIEVLYDVSDPDSANYGQHWNKEQIVQFTQNLESYTILRKFLLSYSPEIEIIDETIYKDYITVRAPVAIWESMFACQFHHYRLHHPMKIAKTGKSPSEQPEKETDLTKTIIRTTSYSLPVELAPHVMAVFHTVQFPQITNPKRSVKRPFLSKKEQKINSKFRSPSFSLTTDKVKSTKDGIDWNQPGFEKGYVTPALIQYYYEIYNSTAGSITSQGVLESLGDALNPNDLSAFQNYFSLPLQAITTDIGSHVDVSACTSSEYTGCSESNLDVQYLMAISQNVPTIYWYIADDNGFIDWITFVTSAANSSDPAKVYSISYTSYELGFPTSTANSFDIEAIKLGVMGTTIVASAGDDGAMGYLTRNTNANCGYFAQYPASSPYVTAVGGTAGPESDLPEVACQSKDSNGPSITSGGGFSTLYPMPSFQESFVNNYFTRVDNTAQEPYYNTTPVADIPGLGATNYPAGYYNRSGRGYPDVSLFAHNYVVFEGGRPAGVDGTSASTPVMAGFINLVNYQRVLQGNSTMGWINPFLYKRSSMFINDIAFGKNNCSALGDNQLHTCCNEGFSATTGWDPITGLGSVNFLNFTFAATGISYTFIGSSPTAAPSAVSSTTIAGFTFYVGADVGIAIGGTVFVLIVAAAIYCFWTRCCMKGRKKGKRSAKVMSVVP